MMETYMWYSLVYRRYFELWDRMKSPREWVQREIQVLGLWARSWDEEELATKTETSGEVMQGRMRIQRI